MDINILVYNRKYLQHADENNLMNSTITLNQLGRE